MLVFVVLGFVVVLLVLVLILRMFVKVWVSFSVDCELWLVFMWLLCRCFLKSLIVVLLMVFVWLLVSDSGVNVLV